MKERYSCVLFVMTILLLPSCFSKKKSKKRPSQPRDKVGSIFTPVSEAQVREDVRDQYVQHHADATTKKRKKPSKKQVARMNRANKRARMVELARELEAKLIDIPIPLNVEPLGDFFNNENADVSEAISLGYNTNMTADQAAEFYRQEMERLGWRCLTSFQGPELLANFVKPGKFCSVSIRPGDIACSKGDVANIVIFSGPTTA